MNERALNKRRSGRMLELQLEAIGLNEATLPGESRVANFANDVQMVSLSFLTSDNNRLAITHCCLRLSADLQVRVRCRLKDDTVKRYTRKFVYA